MIKSITGALARKRATLNENEKGFTLIELLVVVIIIGILAAIAIPIFLGQQASARDSAVKSDIANAKTTLVAAMVASPTGAIPTLSAAGIATGPTSNLAMTTTPATTTAPAKFCISGYDTTNTVSSLFHATDTSGVASGPCPTTTTTTP